MPITYPLSLPAVKSPARIVLNAQSSVAISRSPSSYVSSVYKWSGQMWTAEITLPMMERADAEQWVAWLLKLNGLEGTFLLGDTAGKTPRGIATGTPLVNGGSQTGQSLITDGWTAGQTGIMKAGDYIQIGQRLYKILSDANSDGGGNATFDIWPRLRESPSNNAAITVSNTVGLFRLASNTVPLANIGANKLYAVAFSAMEAI